MKKLLIAFSMIGAGALIAYAGEDDSQPNSVKTNYASRAWFSASAIGTDINTVGGVFSTKEGSEATYEAKDCKIEFESEIDDPVSFVLDDAHTLTTQLAQVTFKLDPSVIPYSALPTDSQLTDVKAAFALVENEDMTATNFQAWVMNDWRILSDFPIPDMDESYDLTMKFDDSVAGSKKVQFTVVMEKPTGNVVTNESAWLEYAGLSAKPQIDFAGSGKLASMNADQIAIVSAEVIFEGGSVTIAEKDATAMGRLVKDGETIEKVLADPVTNRIEGIVNSCELTTAEAYAIGLIANEGGEMTAKDDGTFKVKADAQANVSDGGIAVGFVTPLMPNDTTANVTYTLKGSADGATYTEIEGMTGKTDINEIKIPTSEITGSNRYRYFKVVTTVTLKDAPEQEQD